MCTSIETRTAVIVFGLTLLSMATTACSTLPSPSPTHELQTRAAPAVVQPTREPECVLDPEVADRVDTQWRELKRDQSAHPAHWTFRPEDVGAALDLATNDRERKVLERLYANRYGTPVYLIKSKLTEDAEGVLEALRSSADEAAPEDLHTWIERTIEQRQALLTDLDARIDKTLNATDRRRLCNLDSTELRVEALTPATLAQLEELEVALAEMRRVSAQLDTALVLSTWQLTTEGVADLPSEGFEVPSALLLAKKERIDTELLARAVFAVLRYDSDRRPFSLTGPLIRKVIMTAQNANIDPFVMVTLVFMESRFKPDALGDGGLACGLAQQHSEYSMLWEISDAKKQYTHMRIEDARVKRQRRYECERLKDPEYSMKVLVHVLKVIMSRAPDLDKSICRYNEGPYAPCKGRGLFYLKKHEWWRDTIKVTYDRLLDKVNKPAEVADGSAEREASATRP